jgi:hypothetical protein
LFHLSFYFGLELPGLSIPKCVARMIMAVTWRIRMIWQDDVDFSLSPLGEREKSQSD